MPNSKQRDSNSSDLANNLIPLRKAAEISGLTQQHLALLIRRGDLWGNKLGSYQWFTTKDAVKEYLALKNKPGPKPALSKKA